MTNWKDLAKQEEQFNVLFAERYGNILEKALTNQNLITSTSNNLKPQANKLPTPLFTNTTLQDAQDALEEKLNKKEDDSLLSKLLRKKIHDIGVCNSNLKDNDIYNYENTLGYNETRDPNTPPHTFEDLHLKAEIIKAVYQCGFHRPSRIQELTLPVMNLGKDVIAQSQSGTGKTAAFVIAMLMKIDTNNNYPQAICLSPTFELSLQIYDVIQLLGQCMANLKIGKALKGMSSRLPNQFQNFSIENPFPIHECHIIIGTPGTVLNLIKSKSLPNEKIRIFVLDEADVMLDIQGLSNTSIRINKYMPPNCQRLLFSATYEEDVINFAKSIVPNAEEFILEKPKLVLHNIGQYYVLCNSFEEKLHILTIIYGSIDIGQCIVFCDTKRQASFLVKYLNQNGFPAALLSSELNIEDRAKVIQDFRNGIHRLIVATNVIARGIDIEQVNLVLNFDLPLMYDTSSKSSMASQLHDPSNQNLTTSVRRADVDTYIHRIGRCGRFGKKGLALNLIEQPQLELLRQIEQTLRIQIPELKKQDLIDSENIQNIFT